MKCRKMLFICLLALLILTTGCSAPNGENAVSSATGSKAEDLPSESSYSSLEASSKVSSDNSDWTAYIDDDHNLCIKKEDNSNGKVIVKDVAEAPCVAGEWVYYLPDLDEIDKVSWTVLKKQKCAAPTHFRYIMRI